MMKEKTKIMLSFTYSIAYSIVGFQLLEFLYFLRSLCILYILEVAIF